MNRHIKLTVRRNSVADVETNTATLNASEINVWNDDRCALAVSRFDSDRAPYYRLRYGNELIVDILHDRSLVVHQPNSVTDDEVDHFISDQIVPRMLSHDGELVLHAGAIEIEGRAILVLGDSGRGKSTLVASFSQAGYTVLGDDAAVISSIDTAPGVRAIYPSLRLLPDSLFAVMPPETRSEEISQDSAKRNIEQNWHGADAIGPIPIAAVFHIGPKRDDDRISIDRLGNADTCIAVVANSFALDPVDRKRASDRLRAASKLAAKVPAFALRYPHDYARLPAVRTAMLEMLKQSTSFDQA